MTGFEPEYIGVRGEFSVNAATAKFNLFFSLQFSIMTYSWRQKHKQILELRICAEMKYSDCNKFQST